MKFAHTIKQKTKIAALLFGIMACTILIRVLEDKSIKNMNIAFTSMYNDRLIPATDLFYLAENLYAKRHILEGMIDRPTTNAQYQDAVQSLNKHEGNINLILKKYEQTFLTKQEQAHLIDLKNKLSASKLIEEQLLTTAATTDVASLKPFESIVNTSFNGMTLKLAELTQLQSKVGEELMKDSKYWVSGSEIYSTIQFALAIVIGILIVAILFASNVVKTNNQKFNLN